MFSDNGKALEDFEFDFRKSELGIRVSSSQGFSLSIDSVGMVTQHITGNVGQVAGRNIYNETDTGNGKKKGKRTITPCATLIRC